jgi:hypothetical protein
MTIIRDLNNPDEVRASHDASSVRDSLGTHVMRNGMLVPRLPGNGTIKRPSPTTPRNRAGRLVFNAGTYVKNPDKQAYARHCNTMYVKRLEKEMERARNLAPKPAADSSADSPADDRADGAAPADTAGSGTATS